VASLAEIVRKQSRLSLAELVHLQRLVANWNMLADFCFSDLVLFVPAPGVDGAGPPAAPERFLVVGHVRPSTTQTLYRHDLIGEAVSESQRPLVARSMRLEEIIEGEIEVPAVHEPVRVLCIPVRFNGRTIAVLSREATPTVGRAPGELERTYVEIFNRFARMIAEGSYPFGGEDSDAKESPRVGDGVVVLDRTQAVEYASPNAVSALHRMGVHANTTGMRLGSLGFDDEPVTDTFTVGRPVTQEVERGDVILVLRCIPLLDSRGVAGAVVLFRDVTEVRRRDRLLLSKDATIREIHHRVKNNLQTISSLLQLQARRTASDDAKSAIGESVRRIRSIALVHETLSREAGEDVAFTEIVRPLVQMVAEAVTSPDRRIRFEVTGDAGTLPSQVATPMAVVLTELLQNTADHAFGTSGGWSGDARVEVRLENDDRGVVIHVTDNGVGVPADFDVMAASGLGLSIVRALVTSDLGGVIEVQAPPEGPGTEVVLRIPIDTVAS